MRKNITIEINGKTVTIIKHETSNYICLTEIVEAYSGSGGGGTIDRWLSNKNTIEYLGAWEHSENPDFNYPEFVVIKNEAGVNRFNLSAKRWIEKTNAVGIEARAGRYGGTYVHEDIAMVFCTWLDPIFKLAVIKEFKRLKENESKQLGGLWDVRRFVARVNFRIQTDAVKEVIIPQTTLPIEKQGILYAEASDIIYMAMFGYTSKQWRDKNPELAAKGYNIRDLATNHQLIVLANLEALDAALVKAKIINKNDRIVALRKEAISQAKSLKTSTELEHKLIESPHLAKQKQLSETNKAEEKQTPILNQSGQNSKGIVSARPHEKDKPKDGELF